VQPHSHTFFIGFYVQKSFVNTIVAKVVVMEVSQQQFPSRPSRYHQVPVLRLDVRPARSVGPFILGSVLSEIIAFIRENNPSFPQVNFKYNEVDPLCMDHVLDLVLNGLELRFNSYTQKLYLIRIYDTTSLELCYAGHVFNIANGTTPSFMQIYETFGPSFPGIYDTQRTHYMLTYPGVTFRFAIPERELQLAPDTMPAHSDVRLQTVYVYDEQLRIQNLDALEWRLWVNPSQGLWLEHQIAATNDNVIFRETQTSPSQQSPQVQHVTHTLTFASTAQDVMMALGPPDAIHLKRHNRLRIHTTTKSAKASLGTMPLYPSSPLRQWTDPSPSHPHPHSDLTDEDYFYNYFRLGLDVLFDGEEHTVKKFILHTNFPTHPHFNRYVRCNYRIICPYSLLHDTDMSNAAANNNLRINNNNNNNNNNNKKNDTESEPNNKERKKQPGEVSDKTSSATSREQHRQRESKQRSLSTDDSISLPPHHQNINRKNSASDTESGIDNDEERTDNEDEAAGEDEDEDEDEMVAMSSQYFVVRPDHKWVEIRKYYGPEGKPFIIPSSKDNPFGGSKFYAYKDIIFEVMDKNDYIASVTLFRA
jgi:hypothetical protein